MRKPGAILLSSALVLVLLAAACATTGKTGAASPKDALTRTATALWDAKVKKDWGAVYDMTTAEYQKRVTKADFLSSSLVEVKSYEIKTVTIDPAGDAAQVEVATIISQAGFDFPATVKDKWVNEKGAWRYQPGAAPMK